MAKLKEWKSIEDKLEHFEYTQINTDEELIRFMDKPWNEFYFRGLNSARFRLYSSVQRTWIEQSLSKRFGYDINVFVQREIENARKKLVGYKEIFQGLNDWEILCFLQHYGAPTPLIDFTLDLDAALYFAYSEVVLKSSDNEIDDYISVYGVEKNNGQLVDKNKLANLTIKRFCDIERDFDEKDSELQKKIDSCKNWSYKDILSLLNKKDVDSFGPYSTVKTNRLFCVDDWSDNKIKSNYRTNANVVAQQGVFVVSKNDAPMDELFLKESEIKREQENNRWGEDDCHVYGLMHCWDIHKSLIPRIVNKINEKYNKSSLFPDNYQIAKDVFEDVMK